ncbi:hypothetical protein M408DRAFT_307765, partial [Serendipita vermifera MAFF 305830]
LQTSVKSDPHKGNLHTSQACTGKPLSLSVSLLSLLQDRLKRGNAPVEAVLLLPSRARTQPLLSLDLSLALSQRPPDLSLSLVSHQAGVAQSGLPSPDHLGQPDLLLPSARLLESLQAPHLQDPVLPDPFVQVVLLVQDPVPLALSVQAARLVPDLRDQWPLPPPKTIPIGLTVPKPLSSLSFLSTI